MKKLFIWLIVAAAFLGLVAWRFVAKNEANAKVTQQQGAKRGGAAQVEVAQAVVRDMAERLEAVGNVESPFKVQISPKTSGRIEFLDAREGDPVQVGQVLVKIDPSDVQAQVYQQQANVAEARSRLAQAQLNQGPTNVGVTSQIEQQSAAVDSAKADYDQVSKNADSQIAAANAQAADAEAKVRAAQSQEKNAEAVVKREQASLKNAQTKYDRTLEVYKKGFIAAQDVDDAKTALDVQREAVNVAQGQLATARSTVDSAQEQSKSAKQQADIAARKAKSDIAAAKAKVTQSQAELKVAQANRAQSPAYQQNIAALQASVDAAIAQLHQAQAHLNDTILRSPIKGTVTARSADIGALATPGQSVLEVQFLDWLFITAALPVERSSSIHNGQAVELRFDALGDKVFTGVVSNVNLAADPETRQFSIQIKIDNSDHAIRPGMYARVAVEVGKIQSAVVVPREALRTTPEGTSVVVVDSENVAHVQEVKVGASDDKGIQIIDGVKAGDKVIVLSYATVADGQKVSLGGGGNGKKPGGKSEPKK